MQSLRGRKNRFRRCFSKRSGLMGQYCHSFCQVTLNQDGLKFAGSSLRQTVMYPSNLHNSGGLDFPNIDNMKNLTARQEKV